MQSLRREKSSAVSMAENITRDKASPACKKAHFKSLPHNFPALVIFMIIIGKNNEQSSSTVDSNPLQWFI